MAKSTKTKQAAQRTPASNSLKNSGGQLPSKKNPSKFQPTREADMDMQTLEATDGLHKLFTGSIKDIYWAENHLVKTLPKMISAASSANLKGAIKTHLEQTKTHVQRLEQVFELLDKKPQAKKCDATEGLTKEGEGVIEDTDSGTPARDLGIIMSSQKVEHYEISSYTGLIKLAAKLGLKEISNILSQTLAEEIKADEILSGIADNDIAAGKSK